jgi:aminoglycoside phosphotransferase (APT) family kinase protein
MNCIRILLQKMAKRETTDDTTGSMERTQDEQVECQSNPVRDRFFKAFCEQIELSELLKAASKARDGIDCKVSGNARGAYNVVVFLVFDDGVEWVAKLPNYLRNDNGGENRKIMSEYATLLFLQEKTTVPAPKVYGGAFDSNNPVKSPYIFMEKIKGISLFEALYKGLDKDCLHNTLRQLADVRKTLSQHPFSKIGSLSMVDDETGSYGVDSQVSLSRHEEFIHRYQSWAGPYFSSMNYYANLHQIAWQQCQTFSYVKSSKDMVERWNIHTYAGSLIPSFVGEDSGKYYLAHTDLDGQNIMVDEDGSITGIIDWEFASTLPPRDGEHYPKLLANVNKFVRLLDAFYDDPIVELQEMREFYATQFIGDAEMEWYIDNIWSILEFQALLGDDRYATMDFLETCKFLPSAFALEQFSTQFPWKDSIPPPPLVDDSWDTDDSQPQ